MLSAQLLRRAMEVFGKLPDRTEIAADRGRRVVAPLKLVEHALAKWGHGNLLPMTTHPTPAGLPSLHHASQSAAPAASFKPAFRKAAPSRLQVSFSAKAGLGRLEFAFPSAVQVRTMRWMVSSFSWARPCRSSSLRRRSRSSVAKTSGGTE